MPHVDELHHATQRLVRAVDSLPDDAYVESSLLPGWRRAHVVAHLALNAEALAAALRGVIAGEGTAMYPSATARDQDIEALSGATPSVLRSRLFGGCGELHAALTSMPDDTIDQVIERTPGSDRTFLAGDVAAMRLREVEIHHADLGFGYSNDDWRTTFSAMVIAQLSSRADATLVASDLDRTWQGGPGTPTVTGRASDLGWWLSGRGDGAGLTTNGSSLPGIEAW